MSDLRHVSAPLNRAVTAQARMVRVRLTRKLANLIDGVDLSQLHAGDELELSDRDARLLILEGWASAADSPPNDRRPKRSVARKPDARKKRTSR
jgi:hypothetical protein